MFLLLTCLFNGAILQLAVVLASDMCAAPPPCTCSGTKIHCNSTGLTDIPIFQKTPTTYTAVNLSYNRITRLEKGVFSSLSTYLKLALLLDNNKLNYIADGAFNGLEDTALNLSLGNNNLTTLPKALTRLNNLIVLQINRLESLDSDVMASIGKTLEYLDIGMHWMTDWPQEMKYLSKLKSLNIRGMSVSHFPDTAFRNFENSLVNLNISSAVLNHSPDAICSLHHLQSLGLYYNEISNEKLMPNCLMETVKSLEMKGYSLLPYDMSKVWTTFPNLTHFHMDDLVISEHYDYMPIIG